MNRKELVRRVASVMRENNIRKPVSSPKHVFHITDDEGNSKDFIIKKTDKSVLFTVDDVEAVINTCIDVIMDAIRQGESISVKGFGTLALHYRKARSTIHPETGEPVIVADRYIPKFTYGKQLRMCARVFELSLNEGESYNEPTIDEELEGGE